MPRYILGSELPERLQADAKARFKHRFTGDHRPEWLEAPSTDAARRTGPPDFEDDADWLAHTEFPVSGKHEADLHLALTGQQPRTMYLPKGLLAHGYPAGIFARPEIPRTRGRPLPHYVRGSDLPRHLQVQAMLTKAGQARYTREHRPAWVDQPRANGPSPMLWESDDEWLANSAFAVVGEGPKMRLHRGPYPARVTPTYPDNPELRTKPDADDEPNRSKQLINPDLAIVGAQLLAARYDAPVWVKVEGGDIGDIRIRIPQGADWCWRKVTPDGQVRPLR